MLLLPAAGDDDAASKVARLSSVWRLLLAIERACGAA